MMTESVVIGGTGKPRLVFFLFFFAAFGCLTLQEKAVGEEAVRALHYRGIFILAAASYTAGIWFFYGAPKILRRSLNLPILLTFLSFYFLIFIHCLGMSTRAIKNVLIGSSVDISFMLLIYSYALMREISAEALSEFLARFFVVFSVASTVLAMFVLGGFDLSVGPISVKQSIFFMPRIHGHFGEPTHFGCMAGLGLLSAIYMRQLTNEKKYKLAIYFLAVGLIMSGSRNGILSSVFAIAAMSLIRYPMTKILKVLFAIASFILLLILLYYIYYDDVSQYVTMLLRIGETGDDLRWQSTNMAIAVFEGGNLIEKIIGHGYGTWSAFNFFLEAAINYGVVFVLALSIFILYLLLTFFGMLRKDRNNMPAMYAMMLLIYAVTFAQFISPLFPRFFHVANFTLIISVIIATLIKPSSNLQE